MNGWQLSRRDFNRLLVTGGMALTLRGMRAEAAQTDDPGAIDELAASFANPPISAAPHTSRWTGHPYSMKAEGDRMFCLGINRFVFHTFVHQPHPTAKPGMTMGPFGTHFDRNETWMQRDTGWIRYLTRAQFLLQSGEPVADLCYLKGEEPSTGVPDARLGPLAVPSTYSVDMVYKDSLAGAKAVDGKVSFAGASSYGCMILPPLKNAAPELLKGLLALVDRGMVLAYGVDLLI